MMLSSQPHQLYRGGGPHASLLCTLVCLRSDGDFELNFLMEGEGDGRGRDRRRQGREKAMHACVVMPVAVGRYPQANRSTSKAVYHRPH